MNNKREKFVNEYITESLFLLMKNNNYEDITVTDIVNKAGVSRISFYRNFSSKEDVIQKYLDNITDSFIAKTNISYKNDDMQKYIITLFTHLKEHEKPSRLLQKANLLHLVKNEFDRIFVNAYKGIYSQYKLYFTSGGLYNIYYYWLINGSKESPEELSTKLINLLAK